MRKPFSSPSLFLLLLLGTTQLTAEAAACEGAPGPDGSCKAPAYRKLDKRWWHDKDNTLFTSPNVIQVNTSNFNTTLTELREHPLLIVFYDPRSQSFADSRAAIDDAADALAELAKAAGKPVGFIGAVDIGVDSFLTHEHAPETKSSWQDNYKGSFKFGRPRFLPIILLSFQHGVRQAEFQGAIDKLPISEFLLRHQSAKDGTVLSTATSLRSFVASVPGPFAVGCALSDELLPGSTAFRVRRAFNKTAYFLFGQTVFAYAPEALCEEVFGAPAQSGPRVHFIRNSANLGSQGFIASVDSSAESEVAVNSSTTLGQWLVLQRTEVLREMTPDNSYLFLDNPVPLVAYLVNRSDKLGRAKGEVLFTMLDHRLKVDRYQLVWSDCAEFGPQFGVAANCPVVLAVNPVDLSTHDKSIKALENPASPNSEEEPWTFSKHAVSERLFLWLENVTTAMRPSLVNGTLGGVTTNQTNRTDDDDDVRPQRRWENLEEQPDDTVADESTPFLEELDDEPVNASVAHLGAYLDRYHSMLAVMIKLRHSFKSRYEGKVDFNFSLIEKVQKAHRHMRALAESPEQVQAIVQDQPRLKQFWKDLELRAKFLDSVAKLKSNAAAQDTPGLTAEMKKLWDVLPKACRALAKLFRKLYSELHRHAEAGAFEEAPVRQVEKRSVDSLSVTEFVEKYAKPGIPVIITGLNLTENEPWTLDFFKQRCNSSASYVRRNPKKESWGRLEEAAVLPLPEFIDSFSSNATRRKWYLHDWSLPSNCPEVFGPAPYTGFTVPKYFAGDYFQRAPAQQSYGYRHTWPSLFIGSNETLSAMHVDSGGTNFWLHLLSGRKEWRFYSRKDMLNLYSSPFGAHFHLDVFQPNLTRYPLAKYAEMYSGIQEAGELVFIPGGNPHAVRNLDDIHALSMNYVDVSNVWIYLWLQLEANNFDTFELFTDGMSIPHGVSSEQKPLRFGEWKGTRWNDLSYDLQ